MRTHLIIDGYNLMGARGEIGPGATFDSRIVRETLLEDLAMYHQRKGYAITVVFDAWRERGQLEQQEHRPGLHILYTKGGEKADQVIQRMVRRYGHACVVVSSDTEIMHTAQDHGAFVLTSQEFQGKLRSKGGQNENRTMNAGSSINLSCIKNEDEPKISRSDKKGNPRKLPKAQRRRNRRIKGF